MATQPLVENTNESKEEENKSQYSNDNITVCVTGVSGFLGSHITKVLLDKGYTVIGTVRGDPSSDKYKYIYDLNKDNQIELYQADLTQTDIFIDAFKRCDYIFHVASPVLLDTNDPLNDLVNPAKNGTMNVLNCCLKANKLSDNKIKRVIMTSSASAINGYADPKKIYTEQDWNDYSSLTKSPYSFSKTEAEKSAWKWMDDNNEEISFDLIALCPTFVMGKNYNGKLNESNGLLPRIVNGFFPVRINVAFDIVDARDVAAAHVYFMDDKKGLDEGKGRYIICGTTMALTDIMDHCEEYCGREDVNIKSEVPCCRCNCKCCWCFIMCIACCKSAGEADFMKTEVNNFRYFSNEKLTKLGFEYKYKDVGVTLDYALDYLKECGYIPK